jgi:hypothetical protein
MGAILQWINMLTDNGIVHQGADGRKFHHGRTDSDASPSLLHDLFADTGDVASLRSLYLPVGLEIHDNQRK